MELRTVPIKDIIIGDRVRVAMHELLTLQTSIERVGLLHPIVLNSRLELIAGGRRLAACKKIGWKEIPATIVERLDDAVTALLAEGDENERRVSLTVSELAELGRRLEALEKPKSQERQKELGKSHGTPSGTVPEGVKGDTRDKVGQALGVSGKHYERCKAVVEHGVPELKAMADTKQVSVDAASVVAKLPKQDQAEIVKEGPEAVREAAKVIRLSNTKPETETLALPKKPGSSVMTSMGFTLTLVSISHDEVKLEIQFS